MLRQRGSPTGRARRAERRLAAISPTSCSGPPRRTDPPTAAFVHPGRSGMKGPWRSGHRRVDEQTFARSSHTSPGWPTAREGTVGACETTSAVSQIHFAWGCSMETAVNSSGGPAAAGGRGRSLEAMQSSDLGRCDSRYRSTDRNGVARLLGLPQLPEPRVLVWRGASRNHGVLEYQAQSLELQRRPLAPTTKRQCLGMGRRALPVQRLDDELPSVDLQRFTRDQRGLDRRLGERSH